MRILVVEDERDLRSVLKQSLLEAGYAVDVAFDGRQGLFKAEGVPYDAIVLDLMLPQLDGLSLLTRLRQGGRSTPVLVLTARDGLADRVKGLDIGADDYLTKPFELPELLARLRALVRRAVGKANPVIQVDDICIDTSAKKVTRSGVAVLLTAREYSLVEFLALHKGELVSRSMIYDHLFDEDDDSLSNLVDVHVSNVRKKLGKDFIHTRRGQGYVIDEHRNSITDDDGADGEATSA